MRPSVRYTHDFVRSSLPKDATRILEIGCGSGELAALLMAEGLQVIAVDADPECVAAARAISVEATMMRWPASLNERFDAVLFTRSLHHVGDLPGSVAAAIEVLAPGGRIIVEDFRAEGGSARSAHWFERLTRELHSKSALSLDTTVEAILDKAAPSSNHEHRLHASPAVRHALGDTAMVLEDDAAYYFRYLEPHLNSAETAETLKLELDLIAQGSIDALGKRFVAIPN